MPRWRGPSKSPDGVLGELTHEHLSFRGMALAFDSLTAAAVGLPRIAARRRNCGLGAHWLNEEEEGMMRTNWWTHAALGCCVVLGGAGFACAQRVTPPTPPAPPAPAPRVVTDAPPRAADAANQRTLRAKDVLG